jgi:hypothetical protein
MPPSSLLTLWTSLLKVDFLTNGNFDVHNVFFCGYFGSFDILERNKWEN